MWVQMIKTRVKSGQESTVQQLPQEMDARFQGAQAGMGPKRVLILQDTHDEGAYTTLIFFESEAKAREYERSPEQAQVRQRMMEVWEGEPTFAEFNVIHEMNR